MACAERLARCYPVVLPWRSVRDPQVRAEIESRNRRIRSIDVFHVGCDLYFFNAETPMRATSRRSFTN